MATDILEPPKKRGRGRPRKTVAEKIAAGTFEPARERRYQERERAKAEAEQSRPKIEPDAEAGQDYLAVMRAYMAGVEDGSIVAGKRIRQAVERQRRDEAREGWQYAFSPFFAAKACAFLEQLPHVEGRWARPLIRLEPWQVFVVCCLFGWRFREDSLRRRFTVFYLELGRKNAKTTLAAGIALYHLAQEEEPGAQVVCGATTGAQARIVFNIAHSMILRSAWLARQGFVARANSLIRLDGTMKPINAKANSQDGLNPSCIILDEAHAQDFELHNVLTSAQGARLNPLLICPTTAGFNLLSVGYSLHQSVGKMLEGLTESEHTLGIIYNLDEGDDWDQPENWLKANPMLGVSPSLDQFKRSYQDAKNNNALEQNFLVKSLSFWLGGASAFLSIPKWDLGADPSCKLEKFVGRECCIGGDLSQGDDFTSVAYTFLIDDILHCCVQFYLPEEVVEERARKVPEYAYWAKNPALLKLTHGNTVDQKMVEADIRANLSRFKVKDICFDQYASGLLVSSLFNDGYPARIEHKNSANATPPAKDLELRVKYGRLRHDGNAVLRWQAGNVVVTRKVDGSLLPKKEDADSPNKIDGIEAILRGLGGWLKFGGAPGGGEKKFQAFVLG